MPKVRIHNRTKGSTLPKGVVIEITAGATDSAGKFEGTPSKIEVQVDKHVIYDIPASAFRITAKPKNQLVQAVNWTQQKGKLKKDTDLYIIAVTEDKKDHLDISFNKPTI
jgi:hypothetical protein